MPNITILGAGIAGMSIASQLPRDCKVTILGKHLPGDEMDHTYTSQWAGAIWLGTANASLREQRLQLAAFGDLWRIAEEFPESSVRHTTITDVFDMGDPSDHWFVDKLPEFRMVPKSELPKGAKFGMRYKTCIITPTTFLPWFRARLESQGVVFKRTIVQSLDDLKGMKHDVLINATGFGARHLADVKETHIVPLKQQNIRIRKGGPNQDYNEVYIRRGLDGYYSTAFARGDGTIYIGGVKTEGLHNFEVNAEHRKSIMRNQHLNQPKYFPSPNVEDYDFICDHVGVYPFIKQENGGVRCEKRVTRGQKVVHVYGMEAGGYTFSFGLAREAVKLVTEYLAETPTPSRL